MLYFFTACRFNADIYMVSDEFLCSERTTKSKKEGSPNIRDNMSPTEIQIQSHKLTLAKAVKSFFLKNWSSKLWVPKIF